MTIVAAGSIAGFFNEAVEEAIRSKRVEATGGATNYLVSLLADFARPDERAEETLERPLAFLLDEALHTPIPGERFEKLRILGDGVLYSCGFFGEHFEARGVDTNYLFGIGATAYGSASTVLNASVKSEKRLPDVFSELADKFASFVSVIREIAEGTLARGAQSSRGLVRVYERWLKTGSERLAKELTSQGVLPVRALKGPVQ